MNGERGSPVRVYRSRSLWHQGRYSPTYAWFCAVCQSIGYHRSNRMAD